jgi:hypothetical protein
MKEIYAGGDYRVELEGKVKKDFGWDMELSLQSDKLTGFKPLPKQWMVEHTFFRLENSRRPAKDYE